MPPLSVWRSQRYSRLLEAGRSCVAVRLTAVSTRRLGSAALIASAEVVFALAGYRRRAVLLARGDQLRRGRRERRRDPRSRSC